MLRVIVVIRRKAGMSREDFLAHWLDGHPSFVRRLPGVRAYRQSPAIAHRKEWPYDGMAELFFDSVGDVARAFASDEAASLFSHEDEFIEDLSWFIAEEARTVPLDDPNTGEPGE